MATPKSIEIMIENIQYSVEGPIDDVISFLQKKRTEKKREGFNNLRLDVDAESDYGDSYYARVRLYGSRMETEAEAADRETREAAQQKWYEDRERQQFEALKKKYG